MCVFLCMYWHASSHIYTYFRYQLVGSRTKEDSVRKEEWVFSCRHFEIISDLLFKSVYCDAWVIITTFSLRQSKHLLDILL